MRWSVATYFHKLPQDPEILNLSPLQLVYNYLNIQKDKEYEEDNIINRMNYIGLIINPERLQKVMELQKNKTINNNDDNIQYNDDSLVVNDNFEKELQEAMKGNEMFEIPVENNVRGNPNLSRDEFLNKMNELDKFAELQEYDDKRKGLLKDDNKSDINSKDINNENINNINSQNNNTNNELNNDLDYFDYDE